MAFEFFDPTGGQPTTAQVQPAVRFDSLDGLTCSILDNTKKNGAEIMTMICNKMEEQYGVKLVKHVVKKVGSAPAKEHELAEAVDGVDFVIVGLGDWGSCSSCSVHDGIEVEKRGIPAVVICTDQFEKTGKAIAEMRGMAGYPFVAVPHPVGSLAPDELAGRAEIAFSEAMKLLLKEK